MPKGILREKPIHKEEQYIAVDDMKLRMTITALTDRYTEQVREFIYKCYQDDELASIYRMWRNTGKFAKGNKFRRKLVEFPNPWVYDFVDTVLTGLYGKDWLSNHKALKHDLVRPFWVVEKL